MPTRGEGPDRLVDTSTAVALVVAGHEQHNTTTQALSDLRLGLAGHAAFETFSVLTRLPPPNRRTPRAVERLLLANFPYTRFLSPRSAEALLGQLAALGVAGGAVYDALVGATALEHRVRLSTR
ncbi:MAG: type II toxin-antitoxin system VapC family toxin, partial [Actinomycetota bacterium]|nr:type II toxin-antitoxin system VapC family toxin [Actinomycetota bacterium]